MTKAVNGAATIGNPLDHGITALSGGVAAPFAPNGIAALKAGGLSKLDTPLAALLLGSGSAPPMMATSALHSTALGETAASLISSVSHFDGAVTTGSDGQTYVVIDATAKDGNGAMLLGQLETLGLQQGATFGAMASGYLPVHALGALTALTNLAGATESAMTSLAGLVTSQADTALHADTARAGYGVDGSGLKIGVISDSFNTSSAATSGMDSVATNIANGDLPTKTAILQDSSNGTDEGRGMAQLIHDIAPGAAIGFATGNGGQANFASNILKLAADGAKVIVDDLIYYAEPAYQDGIIAQAVNAVTAQGVTYFSSAGNNGFEGYEQHWVAGGSDADYQYMEFAPGQDQLSFVASGYPDIFVMQWDEPSRSAGGAGAKSDLDVLVYDAQGSLVGGGGADNLSSGNPQEAFQFQGNPGETYFIKVGLYAGDAPNFVKVMALGNGSGVDLGTTERNINDGTTYGHAAAEGANGVAAAFFYETPAFGATPPIAESYTSGGPVRIAFDADGTRLDAPVLRNSTDFTAVDGTNTTFFGSDIASRYADPDSYPNFFGTSAAAPNAAAVAMLLLEANPNLTNADITALLKSSSVDMDNLYTDGFDTGSDAETGAGLIQADLAVGYANTLVINNPTAVDLFGTHLVDIINAGDGNNTISAGAGDDRITGGGGADVLTGGAGADSFIFNSAGTSGVDRINDFDARDVIVTTKAIRDSNGDGLITFGKDGRVNLDDTGTVRDSIKLDGVDPGKGLRYLGTSAGQFYYGRADVRPLAGANQTVIEGTVDNDSLRVTGSGKHVLFFDTAGAAPIGSDKITGFTSNDILVTTQALADGNGDGIIKFGSDHRLDLSDGDSVQIQSGGKTVNALELDGSVTHDGVTYYVYSLVGSSSGLGDLHL